MELRWEGSESSGSRVDGGACVAEEMVHGVWCGGLWDAAAGGGGGSKARILSALKDSGGSLL